MSELLSLCERTVEVALKKGADEAEAFGIDKKETEVFLERNDVKICKTQLITGIGLRIFKSGKLGFASVNLLDPLKVDTLAEKALALSSQAPQDEYNSLPTPKPIEKIAGLYDKECEGLDSGDIFDRATMMLSTVKDYDSRVVVDSGSFTSSVGEKAIINSHGIQASERDSTFQYMMMAFAREGQNVGSFDFFYEGTHKVEEIDTETGPHRLAERVVKSLNARKVESFKGPILASPSTNWMILAWPLEFTTNANNVQKGMSKLKGKIGDTIASPLLTVRDDGQIPGGLASSGFDREGVPHQPLTVIERGKLCSYLHNTYTAKKGGCNSTGHSIGNQRNPPMIGTTNFIVEPGERAKDELISEIKRGILVTRFSGMPEPESGDFSGVVKGGFLIEDGEIVHPLKETLITGNVFELMKNIKGVSKETETIDTYRLPFITVDDVSIIGG